MSAFFDSNIVIDLLAGHPNALAEAAGHTEVGISRITWMEVLIGAPDPTTQARWETFLDQFEMVELDEDVCREGVSLRKLHGIKLPDALIWASARAYGADLVTRNTRDFPRGTPGIRIPYAI
ncbi:MAG: type II toxin-antitoxin system VapC family toxin [Verrucomicrobiae bacterium]|nr:type II toxin-antitoxin system VapC family toxin [Verrucomicrobiae bacterium]MCP5541142.1 type II toxin-antitoxin system VapC family toxin [Akkermansiaceae bacterium]MCP5551263.1 type II toxin-antitoxin system VapC family toxin [Akkermansiaceae bacterium]